MIVRADRPVAAIGRLLGGYWADRSVANNPMRADRPIAAASRRSHTKRVPWRGMQGPQFWRAPSWRAGMMLMRAHEYARTGRDLPRGCSARQARQARHVACLVGFTARDRSASRFAHRAGEGLAGVRASAPRTAPRTARVYLIPTGTNGGRETDDAPAPHPPPHGTCTPFPVGCAQRRLPRVRRIKIKHPHRHASAGL